MKLFAIALSLLFVQAASATVTRVCDGFAPKNTMYIPATHDVTTGISQDTFNQLLDKMQALYGPEFAAGGNTFVIDRRWEDGTVNASADTSGTTHTIHMYGGLARHPMMTRDGFVLVACHEIGHHLGGAPTTLFMPMSNEGQADYYATLKCARKFFVDEDNAAAIQALTIDPLTTSECAAEHTNPADQLICVRSAAAGATLAQVLHNLAGGTAANAPTFETPDPHHVWWTHSGHPQAQCRMDTYFNGSRCPVDVAEELSWNSYSPGTCDKTKDFNTGSRPRCWFKP